MIGQLKFKTYCLNLNYHQLKIQSPEKLDRFFCESNNNDEQEIKVYKINQTRNAVFGEVSFESVELACLSSFI